MSDTKRNRIKAICEVAGIKDIEDLSDGFHTFRQLYYQRMMLFAVIVKQNKDRAWKSLRHEDGELCFGGGWFIVGIDTPEGSYTYHYEDNYFSLFDCEELECGKHWDGHTEKDVTRLLSLPSTKPDNQTNLCYSCDYSYPDCPSKKDDVIFGNGIGNDNICACNKYKPSAQQWIPFKTRPLTEKEQDEYPEWDCILDCKLPDDGQRILVSINLRGHEEVQQDEFYSDDESYLDSGYEIGTEAVAWMPLPEPWRGEEG